MIRSYRRTLTGDRRHLLERFRYVHAARKVVGVGSVGTRAWIVLMLGNDDDDPLFLQIKEAQASVLEPFLGKSKFTNHGQRVVEGQRLMQAASDIMLGWFRTTGIDGVGATSTSASCGTARDRRSSRRWNRAALAATRASAAGRSPARTHAPATRSRSRATSASGDTFDRAMASFAETYADQNEADCAALRHAADAGELTVQSGL